MPRREGGRGLAGGQMLGRAPTKGAPRREQSWGWRPLSAHSPSLTAAPAGPCPTSRAGPCPAGHTADRSARFGCSAAVRAAGGAATVAAAAAAGSGVRPGSEPMGVCATGCDAPSNSRAKSVWAARRLLGCSSRLLDRTHHRLSCDIKNCSRTAIIIRCSYTSHAPCRNE